MRIAELPYQLRRLVLGYPLLAPAVGVWAGAALLGSPRATVLAALGAVLCALPRRATLALLAAGLATGSLCHALAREATVCPGPAALPTVARLLRLEPEGDGRFGLTLELRAQQTAAGLVPLRCLAVVSAGRREPQASEGDTLYLPAVDFEPPIHLVNPGAGDSARSLVAEGIQRVGSLPDGAGILVLERAPALLAFFARLRRDFAARAAALLPAGEARAALLAVAIGRRSELEIAERDRFVEAGLNHLLTAGGLYLALLLLCVHTALRSLWAICEPLALRLPAGRAADWLSLPLPLAWALTEGGSRPAWRAAGIATAWLVARGLGRGRPSGPHLWSAAALVAFGLWPASALDPNLWLLALLLLGLWAMGPALARLLEGPAPSSPRRWAARLLAFTVAGWVAALPFALFSSHRLSPLSLPAQLVALPLGAALSLACNAAVLLRGDGLLRLAFCLARGLTAVAGWTVSHAGRVALPALSGPLWLALGLFAASAVLAQRGHRSMRLVAAAAAVLFAAGLGLSRWRAPALRLTFLSVGQGDSALLELPLGGALVIDGGGNAVGSFDPGRRVVAPELWSRGLGRLDALVLSHPHPDHANGLPYLLAAFDVAEIWSTAEPCPLPACRELERLAATRGVPRRIFSPEHPSLTLEGVRFDALYPLSKDGWFPDLRENDNSLVLRVTYRSFTAILPGDIEAAAEARLTADASLDLGADVLKAPHHGSDTSSGAELVRRVHPKAVVFCVGPRNRFGFPKPEVVARWRAAGAATYRTDDDGAVTFETDGEGFRVTPTIFGGAGGPNE